MFSEFRSGLTYSNVIATFALFLALGGGAYAAFKLPKNSVGSKQIKKGAVNSSKVRNRSLLAADFKAGQLPAGAKGDPCLASDPSCRGPKGDTGPQGPGTLSLDGQFSNDDAMHQIFDRNGIRIEVGCDSAGPAQAKVYVSRDSVDRSFYAWGTELVGTGIEPAVVSTDSTGNDASSGSLRPGAAQLNVTAYATAAGEPRAFVHVDALIVRGSKCNYHVLVIPPS